MKKHRQNNNGGALGLIGFSRIGDPGGVFYLEESNFEIYNYKSFKTCRFVFRKYTPLFEEWGREVVYRFDVKTEILPYHENVIGSAISGYRSMDYEEA